MDDHRQSNHVGRPHRLRARDTLPTGGRKGCTSVIQKRAARTIIRSCIPDKSHNINCQFPDVNHPRLWRLSGPADATPTTFVHIKQQK